MINHHIHQAYYRTDSIILKEIIHYFGSRVL